MNRCVMIIFLAAAVAAAQDPEKDPEKGPDLAKLSSSLAEANKAKDIAKITKLANEVTPTEAEQAGDAEDLMAAVLSKSLKICRKDNDALEAIIEALGKLRSKKGLAALKRIAFKEKVSGARQASVQAAALVALGAVADTKQLGGLEDQTKNRDDTVAKGAYLGLAAYGRSKGKTRKRVAEILMKRLQAEYPRYSPSSGKRVSQEKRQRWSKLSASIIGSLQTVCREPTIASVDDWEQWWKENKKSTKTWRDPKK